MSIKTRLRIALLTCAVVVSPLFAAPAVAVPHPAAPSGPSKADWHPADPGTADGKGLAACIAAAKAERPSTWFCMGGDLTTTTVKGGKVTTDTRTVATDFRDTTGEVRPFIDDYDSWCENGSICGRQISAYIAEVKGNGAYGDIHGVIGTVDFIIRQAFNGQYPRWRTVIIWDSGPVITINQYVNVCRININNWPDGTCGTSEAFFYQIGPSRWRDAWPSETGYDQNDSKLTDSRNYHDDNYGSFYAAGYSQLFAAGTLHTGRWNSCNVSPYCRYYQVPWHS
ncbi:MAG TPA: hypothetical protein VKB69_06935 [Micromonosporaceae bacterium]|nr:hypothetical protein [Micromonosporaceae bacterium]